MGDTLTHRPRNAGVRRGGQARSARAAARRRERGTRASRIVFLVLLLLLVPAARPVQAEPKPPLRVGVLDIRIIFERYKKIPALERQLQAEIARQQEQIRARRTSVEALERSGREGGARRGIARRPSAQAQAQARTALREAQQEAVEELRVLEEHATSVVMADIRRAAALEAIAQGLDIVIDRTDASMLFVRTDAARVVDVTKPVLARMHAQ